MSINSSKLSSVIVSCLCVALALVIVPQRQTLAWLLGGAVVLVAVIDVFRSQDGSRQFSGVGLVGPLLVVATSPPHTIAHLILLIPLGLLDLLGFLFATSPRSVSAALNPLEWTLFLSVGVVSSLVAVVALITPLANSVGRLISGILILAVFGILYWLVPRTRQDSSA
ncbi:hypothetical protein [Ferrimicrobium sp.]|uniref:hypothetical protein n=1 Tax=Ferrimicrobium sp. TaxID=2926050 RepID=UPI00263867C1|nr:hypothetical protein [Ferrimicrobium sp.]